MPRLVSRRKAGAAWWSRPSQRPVAVPMAGDLASIRRRRPQMGALPHVRSVEFDEGEAVGAGARHGVARRTLLVSGRVGTVVAVEAQTAEEFDCPRRERRSRRSWPTRPGTRSSRPSPERWRISGRPENMAGTTVPGA